MTRGSYNLGPELTAVLAAFCEANFGCPAINVIREAVKVFIEAELEVNAALRVRFEEALAAAADAVALPPAVEARAQRIYETSTSSLTGTVAPSCQPPWSALDRANAEHRALRDWAVDQALIELIWNAATEHQRAQAIRLRGVRPRLVSTSTGGGGKVVGGPLMGDQRGARGAFVIIDNPRRA